MGRGQAPYLYQPPKDYNAYDPYHGFNPKAVSQASLVRPPPRPKQVGPLINLNRHPDTYPSTPFGRHDIEPMHKNTKKRVNRARLSQLALRCLQLIGAVGLLVCVICVKIPRTSDSWMIRIPIAIDTAISTYNVYTLVRNSKAKTPTNNASYHVFALIMDVGLIPFFILTTMVANSQYSTAADNKDRWTSLFDSLDATNKLIQTTWIASAVMTGLHGVSVPIDLYMIIVFRKIAAMPPDMNPLEEDKLTRRKHKHKYKNSEVTLVDEKHMSEFMGTTANSTPNRMSRASETSHSDRDSRKISFSQSRTEQKSLYSPHNPKTAHISRTNLAETMYQQNGATVSRINLDREPNDAEYSHRTSPMPAHPKMQKRPAAISQVNSSEQLLVPNSREDLAKDNAWFAVGDGTEDEKETEARHNPYSYGPLPQQQSHQQRPGHERQRSRPEVQQRLSQQQLLAHPMGPDHRNYRQPVVADDPAHLPAGHPLHMNPPTPLNTRGPPSPPPQPIAARNASRSLSPTKVGFSHHTVTRSRADDELLAQAERSKTMTSEVSALSASSKYSDQETEISDLSSGQGFSTRTAPSRQLYGDLAAAMRGVRHQPLVSPRPKSHIGSLHWASSEASYSDSSASHAGARGHNRGQSGTIVRKDRYQVSDIDEDEDQPLAFRRSGMGRVISRSGVDFNNAQGDLGSSRRRDVSGKVAEEGRGGVNSGWFAGGLFRRVSGVPQSS